MKNLALRSVLYSWTVVGLGALFYCYEYLLRTSPSVMTQELMRFYHLTGAEYGNLSGSFYYYSYVIMQILVGLLMDRYGPRRLLTLACAMCAVGAFLFACSDHISIAMLGRFLIGLGSAFAFVGAAKLATIWLPPERFALISGIIFCLGMLGAMFGSIILHYLMNLYGWQVAIYGAAIVGALLTGVLWCVVRDTNPYHENHYSHHTPTLKEVLAGLGLALRNKQVWLVGVAGCVLYLFLSAFAELWGPSYLEEARGMTASHAVSANSLVYLGCAIGSPLWGLLSDYIELRRLPILISAAAGCVVISFLLYMPHLSHTQLMFLLFLFGFTSSAHILVFAVVREITPIKIAGTTIGLLNMLVMAGGFIFPPIVGGILDLNWHGTMIDGARVYSPHAFMIALSILPLGSMLGFIGMYFVRETHSRIYLESEHP